MTSTKVWERGFAVLLLATGTAFAQAPPAPAAPETGSATVAKPDRPVEAALEELSETSSETVPPAVLEAGRKGREELIASGMLDQALNVGGTMPSFVLPDAHGRPVASAGLLARGPLVVVFYRGAWCPFCNLYLRSLQKYLPEFRAHGATLVAISGESPDGSLGVEQQNGLEFVVLSDTRFEVARRFRIVYEMPKVVNDAILALGFDLSKYYGTEKAELPLSATYVVDKSGKIVFAFLDPDYRRRAEPADILAALSRLR
jgi:peroxiredoxin